MERAGSRHTAGLVLQTFDWLEAYWRHFGGEQRLRVLVVRAAGKPIGIVPLCVKQERRHFGSVRMLTYPLDGWGAHYSPLGGCQAATLILAMRHIASTPRDWDLIDLPWVDDGGTDRGRTAKAMQAAGFGCVKTANDANSIIDMNEGWDAYLKSRCSKVRQDMRRTLRRFGALQADGRRGTLHAETKWGAVEYTRHRPGSFVDGDGDPAWSLYDECEEVARHSWQAESTNGNTLCHNRYREFPA